jgi:2-dehydro-3-deoxyphosphooctonate aldolase (KDO 8-P synthase)
MRQTKEIKIGEVTIGGGSPLVLIAGPCVIESRESSLQHAKRIKEISAGVGIPFIFKSSYDKANRTSIDSYRGPGLIRGLQILKEVKEKFKVPILSDVHCRSEIEQVQTALDIIQIPAFLSRQTDFIVAVAKTGKVVNIKKGQFLAPWDMKSVIEKVEQAGNQNILITERGTTFGYNNLVSDLRSLQIIREFGYPVIYDATHSVQLPSGRGVSSGGQREFVPGLAKAAVAMGCDGLFIEVHENPDKALSDGPNTIALSDLEELLIQVKEIDRIVRKERS